MTCTYKVSIDVSLDTIYKFYPKTLCFKPIFHQNAKYLASGVGVGQCTRRQNFALPNAKYTNMLVSLALGDANFSRFYPTRSQWNIGCVGCQRKIFASGMYISCFLCRFHLRRAPNANPFFGGIWALNSYLGFGKLITFMEYHKRLYS